MLGFLKLHRFKSYHRAWMHVNLSRRRAEIALLQSSFPFLHLPKPPVSRRIPSNQMLGHNADAVLNIQVVQDHSRHHHQPNLLQKNDPGSTELQVAKANQGFERNKPAQSQLSPVAKILFLDGVRGAAVIFVVTQHTGYMHDLFMGAVGVDAFFVLSSFLLTMIFMKKSIKLFAENASYRKWGYTLADYFSKRFFRVYPLFALLSIALWLMPFEYKNRYYLVKQPEDFNLFQTLTFHPEHRHYLMWTLPLEISYYFILPAFVLAVLKVGRFWWMTFVPLYVWVIHEGLYTTRDNFYRQPLSKHLPTFVAGSMAAVVFVKMEAWIKATSFNFRTLHVLGLRVVEFVLIAAYLSVVFRGLFFNWLGMPLPPDTRYIMPFTSVKLSMIIVIEMIQPSTVSLVFEWIVLRYLGKISFSVYLLHVFVIFTPPIKQETNYYDKTFAVFGLVLLLATASYHLIEYPSQLLAERISRLLAERSKCEHQRVAEESDTEDSDDVDTTKSSAKLLVR